MATQRLKQRLTRLTKAELVDIRDYVAALIEQAEAEKRKSRQSSSPGAGGATKKGGRGWVELKMINGCGPYAYRRWMHKGRCRSQYIGKVKVEE